MPALASVLNPSQNSAELVSNISEPEAEIIERVEQMYGDYITITQAYYIGKLIGMYGPKRVMLAISANKERRDPIRYIYHMMITNQLGKPIKREMKPETKYIDGDNWTW